jgi:hypothetical protein
MATEKKDDDTIEVLEQPDGSVSVTDREELVTLIPRQESEGEDDGDEEGQDEDAAESAALPNESETDRAARNRAAKQRRKENRSRAAQELEALRKELAAAKQEAVARFAEIDVYAVQQNINSLDARIKELDSTEAYANGKYKEAISNADGAVAAEALGVIQRLTLERANLANQKEQMLNTFQQVQAARQRAATPQPATAAQTAFSPLAVAMAKKWQSGNDWFVQGGQDTDSQIATGIEAKLFNNGSNPEDPEHWEKLDKELRKHLPHRYASGEAHRGNGAAAPQGPALGGNSETPVAAARAGSVTLPAEFVKNLKDAGVWDNVNLRNRAIRDYKANYAKR